MAYDRPALGNDLIPRILFPGRIQYHFIERYWRNILFFQEGRIARYGSRNGILRWVARGNYLRQQLQPDNIEPADTELAGIANAEVLEVALHLETLCQRHVCCQGLCLRV